MKRVGVATRRRRRAPLIGLFGLCLTVGLGAGAVLAQCPIETTGEPAVVQTDDVKISLRIIGSGTPVIFVPSLGRSVSDFDDIARRLAAGGVQALLPDPRGFGETKGSMRGVTLEDLARDVIAVAEAVCADEVAVVGHAFGGRVASLAAVLRPELVTRVVLLAADGQNSTASDMKKVIAAAVAQGFKPETHRLAALERAFFAAGNDARLWLDGWHPLSAAAQSQANRRTDRAQWWGVGTARVLVIQGALDPVTPPSDAAVLARTLGPRGRFIVLPDASHAMLPEQPAAIAAALLAYLKDNQVDYDRLVRGHLVPEATSLLEPSSEADAQATDGSDNGSVPAQPGLSVLPESDRG